MQTLAPTEDLFEGAVSFERGDGWIKPWRLPLDQLRLFPPDDGIVPHAETAAGVRLRFAVECPTVGLAVVATSEPRIFDLTLDGKLVASAAAGAGQDTVLFPDLPAERKIVELWLPNVHPVAVRSLLIDDGAYVEAVPDDRPRWITYGSSISHCGAARSPARTWPAIVARLHNLNLTCLGYGGNCHLDPMVAMMIRELPADVISLKVGINIQGGLSLSPRTFRPALIGFIRIIRQKHPHTPIAVISPIISPPREQTPNALGLSLQAMREEIQDALQRLADCGDENLHYFSGLDVLGEDLVEYLPDDVHPNADGYEILGRNIADLVFKNIPLTRA